MEALLPLIFSKRTSAVMYWRGLKSSPEFSSADPAAKTAVGIMDSSMASDRRIHSILLPAACLLPIVLISPFSYNLQGADFDTKKAPSSESAGFSLFNYHISYKQHD